MRILVVGAGRVGAQVILQLQKNQDIKILSCDPREEPYALQKGIVSKIDIQETLTPLTMNYIISQAKPDLVLLARTSGDMGLGNAPGMDIMVNTLKTELVSISNVPIIEVTCAGI